MWASAARVSRRHYRRRLIAATVRIASAIVRDVARALSCLPTRRRDASSCRRRPAQLCRAARAGGAACAARAA
eukprot:12686928-Alexandrium_andersonii.AAC.1